MGLICGIIFACELNSQQIPIFDNQTAMGSLLNYITGDHLIDGKNSFQPMNVNYGLFEPFTTKIAKKSKKQLRAKVALEKIQNFKELCNLSLEKIQNFKKL